jgi:peroxiredoxin Q/BCP
MTHLKSGDKAPSFSGIDQNGRKISLTDFSGKNFILYFYPKDNTPGCTAQACSLRDGYDELVSLGYDVVGVSPDSEKSHQNFIAKFSLPFPLIADTDRSIATAFGVYGQKMMYGKPVMGIHRTTFIIEGKGIITEIFSKVDTKEHVKQIVEK